MDIGTSTGGFTDCMLQRGARSVLGIDTGHGQIAERLRTDPRVELMERTNARLLEPGSLDRRGIAFFAIDVSFISATLVLPAVVAALGAGWIRPLRGPRQAAVRGWPRGRRQGWHRTRPSRRGSLPSTASPRRLTRSAPRTSMSSTHPSRAWKATWSICCVRAGGKRRSPKPVRNAIAAH